MATSGDTSFNLNRDQIIKAALRKVGAIQSSETPSADMVQDASDILNVMVKGWMALGIHVWTEAEATMFLQPNQIVYVLGTGSTDNATEEYDQTEIATGAILGQTALQVASTTGMTIGDFIGVVLDSGEIQWTTISLIPSGTAVTIATPLTDSASATNFVYSYTTKIVRPLRVPFARRYNILSAIDTPMITISRKDYQDLPNKLNTGIPTQYWYTPQGGANTTGQMSIWPAPVDSSNAIHFTYYRPIQDFDASSNTSDLPQEWLNALIWNLAKEIAPEYGLPMERYQIIAQRAAETLDMDMGWDREPESANFGVDFSMMGR